MKLGYEDGRITCHDLEASPVVLENVRGLTEKVVSEIVRNANIGAFVLRRIGGSGSIDLWEAGRLIRDILDIVARERTLHHHRSKP